MKSINEVTKAYKKLLKDVETEDFYQVDLSNRVNCYTCQSCGHITKTKDVDAGVTPFLHSCERCGSEAQSSFYREKRPGLEPTQEWYRPGLEETLKLRKREGLLDHVLRGGLLNRSIVKKETR